MCVMDRLTDGLSDIVTHTTVYQLLFHTYIVPWIVTKSCSWDSYSSPKQLGSGTQSKFEVQIPVREAVGLIHEGRCNQ